jgi:Skp family chaperone for outer membrane proteins
MTMMNRKMGAALASVLALAAIAPSAYPQSAAAPAAPPLTGPPIPGLCALSEPAVILNSTVGKYVNNRLTELKNAAEAEVQGQATPLQNDEKAFVAERASLTADQVNQRGAALQAREEQLSRLIQLRNAEMTQTGQNERNQIFNDALPIIHQVAKQHNCSVVLSNDGVLSVEPSMDLTGAVIEGLNTTVTQIQFDRVHLDQSTGAPAQ